MIKQATIIASFLLALFTGYFLLQILCGSTSTPASEISMFQYEDPYPTKQERSGVVKDLWISDKKMGRLHHHIESPQSILTAIPSGNRIELIEQMSDMKCYFQEKVETDGPSSTQHIRYLHSDEGTYRYGDQCFNADAVFLALYQVPGKILTTNLNIEEAFLQGIAQKVSLSFSKGSPNFHADKFKAQVRPKTTTHE